MLDINEENHPPVSAVEGAVGAVGAGVAGPACAGDCE
jgi:hypothetical protein